MELPSFPHINPDKIDDVSSYLSSFADLRRNNLESLYGHGDDKSPKGSVDEPIKHLVDLINHHPSFVTLSSCSGRIAVFDPKEGEEGDDDRTAKGRGEWILVAHETVDSNILVPLLSKNSEYTGGERKGPLVFKYEPFLLHVAASNLERGRQLLNLALQLGLRESGLILSPSRVTVAIRSHSLALTVPLAYSGSLRPSNEYLVALVEESNQRMKTNAAKLQKFYSEIQANLFRPRSESARTVTQVQARFELIPPLNLWGHAAVVVPSIKEVGAASIFVFGGYGSGPMHKNTKGHSSKVGRSNQIYMLRKHSSGEISKHWKKIEQMEVSSAQVEEKRTTWFGVEVKPTNFGPTEGLQACLLPLLDAVSPTSVSHPPTIAIWGGRSGPACPFGELLLYEPKSAPNIFSKPIHIRGDHPSPRWGHTLTALSGKDGLLAILIGGRNERGSIQDNIHLLKLVEEGGQRFFEWTSVFTEAISPQFHHCVSVVDEDTIVLGGGLADSNDLTECFSDSYRFVEKLGSSTSTGRRPHVRQHAVALFRIEGDSCDEVPDVHVDGGFMQHYGCGACSLIDYKGERITVFAGGILMGRKSITLLALGGEIIEPLRWYSAFDGSLTRYNIHYDTENLDKVNFASLVHHCCVSLPGSSEMFILGGGVSTFAFGASFAKSYRVRLGTVEVPEERTMGPRTTSLLQLLSNLAELSSSQIIAEGDETVTDDEAIAVSNVVYVAKRDANAFRSALEGEGLLDKNHRMTKAADPTLQDAVAVPVNSEVLNQLSQPNKPAWAHYVVSSGKQEMPLSTAAMGSRRQQSLSSTTGTMSRRGYSSSSTSV
jgi:tRNA wybutosine-synthesizing protein 3